MANPRKPLILARLMDLDLEKARFHFPAADGATPRLAAAARQVSLARTAATTRMRRPVEQALGIPGIS